MTFLIPLSLADVSYLAGFNNAQLPKAQVTPLFLTIIASI